MVARRLITLIAPVIFLLSVSTVWAQDYTLGSRDVLRIKVYDHPDLDAQVRVNEEGRISFPLLGEISVSGLTVEELERRITALLADGYIVKPHVSVFVEEFRVVVYVSGEVKQPGSYPFREGMTVIKVISLAGGFTEKAADRKIRVVRKDKNQKEISSLIGIHELVRPNDLLRVPEKRWVYVTGEVKKPGSYLYDDQMTILKAIALAGGLTDKAAPGRTRIIRNDNGKEVSFKVKMEDSIEPEDVIMIPESFF